MGKSPPCRTLPSKASLRDVSPRLALPLAEAAAWAASLQRKLNTAQLLLAAKQFILLVNRSPNKQAALLNRGSVVKGWFWGDAAPVSTGLPGRYEHFLTPLGECDHSLSNPDFRAEGTKNKLGFRGYGRKSLRICDLGWVNSVRGWGEAAMGVLRLQMHATDPDLAEKNLVRRSLRGAFAYRRR